jgi:hypothetical protein
VFLVTDSEEAFAEMVEAIGASWPTSMLYRDYPLCQYGVRHEGSGN